MSFFFSIITVCYNSEKTIERTLKSVANQKYGNYEYIIVDGKSTDNTNALIQQYKANYPSCKYVSEPDTGIYNAMNKAIALAAGEYVLILNSDDYYDSEHLSMLNDTINNNPDFDVYYGDTWFVEGESIRRYESNHYALPRAMTISHMSIAVKRKLILQYPFNEQYKIASDWASTLQISLNGHTFHKYPQCTTYFTVGGVSTDPDKYSHELHDIHNRFVYPLTGLTYSETITLFEVNSDFAIRNNLINKFQHIIDQPKIALFLLNYTLFMMGEYEKKVNRYENSKIWKIHKTIKRIITRK